MKTIERGYQKVMMFIPNGIVPQKNHSNFGTFDTFDLVALDVHKTENTLVLELMLKSGHSVKYTFDAEEENLITRLVTYFRHGMGSNAFRDIPFKEYENMINQQIREQDEQSK